MTDVLIRLWSDLVDRFSGPMWFRFVLQPSIGLLFAALDGIRDVRNDRPPYGWALINRPEERPQLLKEAWQRFGRLIVVGVVMDVVYQVSMLHTIYPVELIDIVVGFAVLPYLIFRGLFTRIGRVWTR